VQSRTRKQAHLKVWCLSAALLGAAAVVNFGPISVLSAGAPRELVPWWLLAAAFILAERNLLDLEIRRQSHSYSLFEIPLVIGFFFAAPGAVFVAQLVSLVASLWQRLDPVKKAFNFAIATLSVGVALCVFHHIADLSGPTSLRNWLAAFAATLSASMLEATFVMLAMFLSTKELPDGSVKHTLAFAGVVAATNSSLALMATTIIWFDGKAAVLFLVPTIVIFFAYRAYLWQRRKSASLESLYESTRMLHHSVASEPATRALLEQARTMFRSETSEFLLFASTEGEAHLRLTLDAEDQLHVVKSTILDPNDGVWAWVATEDRALLCSRPVRDERLARFLARRDLRDAMVAPLRDENGVIGTLLVGNRTGDTFRRDDLPLFETLANHASVSLANARLLDRVRDEAAEKEYQSLHDALTGLPNRSLFRDRVEQALVSAREDGSLAIMLMDLDRFKEVNDTLGHHNGDLLLQEVARRLRTALDPEVTVARLSGDEFALLLPHVPGIRTATQAAKLVHGVLRRPFVVAGVEIDIDASIGVAVHPLHGDDAHKLIQRADIAMYAAKEAHSGHEVYSTDQDGYSAERLALASELRQAIDNEEPTVHYQPKVDMRSGLVTGVEALVRWTHPVRGFMSPDEFIPVAEHTGLIRPLTTLVLRSALRQCRAWSDEGRHLGISVNLSVRSLLDLQLPTSVESLLAEFNVPPSQLTLEITESSIMADPIRAADVVDRLSELGVGLAIDDFGTGYSSLSYLKRLPVNEIKIDKSFVMAMMDADNDAVIVRSTIDLGRNLGMRVVAEGVESFDMWLELEKQGCDVAQGYFVSKPLPPHDVLGWLAEWIPPTRSFMAAGAS
jgi:diguanylate cyclase (GGDEF)-like protein